MYMCVCMKICMYVYITNRPSLHYFVLLPVHIRHMLTHRAYPFTCSVVYHIFFNCIILYKLRCTLLNKYVENK